MQKAKNAAKAPGAKAATKGTKEKAKNLANVVETVVKKEQRFLYKFQLGTPKLTAPKAKQYRQKLRRQLGKFYFSICLQKNAEKQKEAIHEFLTFYKKEFILHDFSVSSVTDSRDEANTKGYADMLKVVQAHAGKK